MVLCFSLCITRLHSIPEYGIGDVKNNCDIVQLTKNQVISEYTIIAKRIVLNARAAVIVRGQSIMRGIEL